MKKSLSTAELNGDRRIINGEKILILSPGVSGEMFPKKSNKAKTQRTRQNLKKK